MLERAPLRILAFYEGEEMEGASGRSKRLVDRQERSVGAVLRRELETYLYRLGFLFAVLAVLSTAAHS